MVLCFDKSWFINYTHYNSNLSIRYNYSLVFTIILNNCLIFFVNRETNFRFLSHGCLLVVYVFYESVCNCSMLKDGKAVVNIYIMIDMMCYIYTTFWNILIFQNQNFKNIQTGCQKLHKSKILGRVHLLNW